MTLFLIRLGELTLKKGSRPVFEKTLKRNITAKLKDIPHQLKVYDGRYYVYLEREEDAPVTAKILSRTFGIADFHRAFVAYGSLESIKQTLNQVIETLGAKPATFKVEVKRVNKSIPLGSYETCCKLGEYILTKYPFLAVDVHNPDWTIVVEMREQTYVYAKARRCVQAGPGGLPVGTAGRAMLLLSGGIDSPVAGWMMAKRGLQLLAVHFHTPPYTGYESLQKVKDLAKQLALWNTADKIVLFIVDFTAVQLKIRQCANQRYTTILARSCMMRIAELLAEKEGASVLITGEALAQVASQTLEGLSFTDGITKMLVLRPLIGMDKQDIIQRAEALQSFSISIQKGVDCCSLFAPDNPVTHPQKDKVQAILTELDLDALVQAAADQAKKEIISSKEPD